MNIHRLAPLVALCAAAALNGCGGGGGSASAVTPPIGATPTPASTIPGPSSVNSYTSYTVYSGTAGGQTYLEVMPLGMAPATLSGASAVPGAIIQYPDGSAQIADTLGNFDASQSAWALTNLNMVLSNPGLEPEVIAFQPGASVSPADAYVQVYSNQANTTTASHARRILSGAASTTQDLAGVAVFPRGYAMFDTESRVYHAVGVDSDGTFMGLGGASVNWSLALPAGCSGSPAGRLSAVPADLSRAVYTPPSGGNFPGGCQDIVTASVVSNATSYSGSGNAFYYDASTAVNLQGQLSDSTNKAVAGGVVDLYGGGREFYHGKLFAIADANGNFKRLVPSNRTLYPFGGNPVSVGGKTTYAFFTVNPSSLAVGSGGSTTTQNLQETSLKAVNPFKPLPPVERFIRDGWLIGDLAQEAFPFGQAQSGGTFLAGSLENILQTPSANAAGTITSGAFTNWSYAWDSSAQIVTLQQPASQEGGRHAIQITIAGATMQYPVNGSTTCPSNNTCYNFLQYDNPAGLPTLSSPIGTPPQGTILAQDGSFVQDVIGGAIAPAGSNFVAGLTRNVYSVGHQIAGQPLYLHAIAYSEVPGSPTSTVSDTWSNAAGKSLATIAVTRTAGSGSQLFTYSGSGTRSFYKPDGSPNFTANFSLSNGILNNDRSGSYTATITSGMPNPTDNGSAVAFTRSAPSPGANRATGTVDNPNVTGLQSGHVAAFSVSPTWVCTVTMDLNLGGNVVAFHL